MNSMVCFVLEVILKDHRRPHNLRLFEFMKTAASVFNGRFWSKMVTQVIIADLASAC